MSHCDILQGHWVAFGLWLGKTHVLTETPDLLQAKGLVITYNLDHNRKKDHASYVEALLVRLMLSAIDLLKGCSIVLTKNTLRWGEIVTGTNEVMTLGANTVKLVMSELVALGHIHTTTDPQSRCTCMVSS